MTYKVGDLVQFKLEHANRKQVWRSLPVLEAGWQSSGMRVDYLFRNYSADVQFFHPARGVEWKETAKQGMIVIGFTECCFTRSNIPAVRKAATKRFAQVMIFSSQPMQAPLQVWALADELEIFNDKPYMESLKARLRDSIAQKAKQPTNV